MVVPAAGVGFAESAIAGLGMSAEYAVKLRVWQMLLLATCGGVVLGAFGFERGVLQFYRTILHKF